MSLLASLVSLNFFLLFWLYVLVPCCLHPSSLQLLPQVDLYCKKVKAMCLCLTKRHAMKTYGGVEVQLHAYLTPGIDGGEWSASGPGRFTLKEGAPGTHWIGGWMGPRTVLDAVMKRKIPSPRRESNPRTPIVLPVAQRYTN
jgi:hypothetical protein